MVGFWVGNYENVGFNEVFDLRVGYSFWKEMIGYSFGVSDFIEFFNGFLVVEFDVYGKYVFGVEFGKEFFSDMKFFIGFFNVEDVEFVLFYFVYEFFYVFGFLLGFDVDIGSKVLVEWNEIFFYFLYFFIF